MRRVYQMILAVLLPLFLYLLNSRLASPKPELAAVPASPSATVQPFHRWGHAVQSVAQDGTGFFDLRSARAFVAALPKDQQRYAIELVARSFLPDEGAAALEALPANEPVFAYIQFRSIPDATERAAFAAAGLPLDQYVTAQTWSFSATPDQLKKVASRTNVRAILPADARDKLHPHFWKLGAPDYSQRAGERVELQLLAKKGSEAADLLRDEPLLAHAQLAIGTPSTLGERYAVTVPKHQDYRETALALARSVAVSYVEPAAPPVASRDSNGTVVSRDAVTDDSSNIKDVRDEGLLLGGTGVVVAVREIGRQQGHIDYSSRLTEVETDGIGGNDAAHATQVCGQVAGLGFNNPDAKGVAPKATLRTYSVGGLNDQFATTDITNAAANNARISNHSYGPPTNVLGDYTSVSSDFDNALLVNNHIGFFAGNEVGTPRPIGQDFFVGAKNTVCVSSTNSVAHAGDDSPQVAPADGLAFFSFFGPMQDGRVKPDLVAFGVDVRLVTGSNSETTSSGTSFSTPATAGVAALVLEHYRNVTGTEPSAAMLKALLCNSATDLGEKGPDAKYGFGIVNAEAAANLVSLGASPDSRPYFEGVIGSLTSNGNTFTTAINVDNSGQPLKVMLCWFDPGGNPSAAKALVNDLNLKITKDGVDFFPYSLNPANPLAAATNSAPNTVDPIEQIVIENPGAGTYTITITANIPSNGTQSFALVSNRPPAEIPLTANIIASPKTGPAPLTVSFQAGTIDFGANATYSWTFGDGTTGSGFNLTHVYQTPGLFTVNLTITLKNQIAIAAPVDIIVTKREASVFAKKAQLTMKYALDNDIPDDSLQFSVVIPELVRTPQQARDAIRDGTFEGEEYGVTLTIADRSLTPFTALLDRRAQYKDKNAQFSLNLTRGEVTVRLKKVALDNFFGLNADSPNQMLSSFKVRLVGPDVDYTTDLPLDYVKAGKGGRGKYPFKR